MSEYMHESAYEDMLELNKALKEDTLVSYQFDGKTFRKEVAPDSADRVARQISEAFGQAVIEYYDAVTGEIVYASLFEEGRKTSN